MKLRINPIRLFREDLDREADSTERRRNRYVTQYQYRKDKIRGYAAYALVVAVSTLAGYLGYNAGHKTDVEQERSAHIQAENARKAVLQSCLSRADLRITTAIGLDGLRSAALTSPRSAQEKAAIKDFFKRTQQPIDKLLSQAAGVPIHVRPEGPIHASLLRLIHNDIDARCAAESNVFTKSANMPTTTTSTTGASTTRAGS